jgi:hypothetical protein
MIDRLSMMYLFTLWCTEYLSGVCCMFCDQAAFDSLTIRERLSQAVSGMTLKFAVREIWKGRFQMLICFEFGDPIIMNKHIQVFTE